MNHVIPADEVTGVNQGRPKARSAAAAISYRTVQYNFWLVAAKDRLFNAKQFIAVPVPK